MINVSQATIRDSRGGEGGGREGVEENINKNNRQDSRAGDL
jgi:hypothetical protein